MGEEIKPPSDVKLVGKVPAILAVGILILFSTVFFTLLFKSFPDTNKDIIMGLADTLKNIMFVSFGYYLGGTHTFDKAAIMKTTIESQNQAAVQISADKDAEAKREEK